MIISLILITLLVRFAIGPLSVFILKKRQHRKIFVGFLFKKRFQRRFEISPEESVQQRIEDWRSVSDKNEYMRGNFQIIHFDLVFDPMEQC